LVCPEESHWDRLVLVELWGSGLRRTAAKVMPAYSALNATVPISP